MRCQERRSWAGRGLPDFYLPDIVCCNADYHSFQFLPGRPAFVTMWGVNGSASFELSCHFANVKSIFPYMQVLKSN